MATETDADRWLKAILDDPGDRARLMVYADWCEEQGKAEEAAAACRGRMLLDDADRMAAVALEGCTMLPRSWDKRFLRSVIQPVACEAVNELSPKQRKMLWRLAHKYRRQIEPRNDGLPPDARRYVVKVAWWLAGN
jgi:uncharacterized protein (TIGR02996 family)